MKLCLLLSSIFFSIVGFSQEIPVESQVYSLSSAKVIERASGKRIPMVFGNSRDFEYLEMHATSLVPGASPHAHHEHGDIEELIIVKEGILQVSIEEKVQDLKAGSIAMIMPGDMHGIVNAGSEETTYYTLRYRARKPKLDTRGEEAGGSFIIHWDDVNFRETEKGGVRSFFERPTAMCERFEMHVTTLNPGLQSHPPHTHRAGEIILMIEGKSKEQIDDAFYQAEAGDFYFLESESLHTIENTGEQACMYFAFQFN